MLLSTSLLPLLQSTMKRKKMKLKGFQRMWFHFLGQIGLMSMMQYALPQFSQLMTVMNLIPEADQPPPPQGHKEHNEICDMKATSVSGTPVSVWIPRELPITLFLLFEFKFLNPLTLLFSFL